MLYAQLQGVKLTKKMYSPEGKKIWLQFKKGKELLQPQLHGDLDTSIIVELNYTSVPVLPICAGFATEISVINP